MSPSVAGVGPGAVAVLAFEATGRSGSWCYRRQSGELVEGDCGGAPAAARLVPDLHRALLEHGRPRHLAVAIGPGSFTGLRVAVVAARSLAWSERLPVRGVDSLLAIACAAGPGLWWVLLPLKADTTFHALVEVTDDGHRFLAPTSWCLDAELPVLHPATRQAIAIGPALAVKSGLAQRWCPGVDLGADRTCRAAGVLRAADSLPDGDWRDLEVAYRIPSAPELQRDRQRQGANG